MEKETIEICAQCGLFSAGECILHKIEVCYNDEVCKDFIEGEKDKSELKKNKII